MPSMFPMGPGYSTGPVTGHSDRLWHDVTVVAGQQGTWSSDGVPAGHKHHDGQCGVTGL